MNDSYQLQSNSAHNKVYTTTTTLIAIEKLLLPDTLFDQSDFTIKKDEVSFVPLIVFEIQGKYQIIDGCKRFLHASQNNRTEYLCTVLSPSPDQKDAAFLRIKLNRNKPLSISEKLLYLQWLRSNLNDKDYSEITATLPISSSERHELEKVIPLPDYIAVYMKKSQIDLSVIPDLMLVGAENQKVLLEFLSCLQFSRSSQREIIEWVPEIAYRDQTSVSAILESSEIQQIISNNSTNQPQKIQKIRDILYRRRFPTLVKLKDQWTELARKVNPDPSHVQFIPSDSFEKNRLEIKLTISNADEILSIFEKLKNIPPEQWKKLIYPA